MSLPSSMQALVEKFRDRKRPALARAISVVEDERPGFHDLLHELLSDRPSATRVGVTGPPGAGKSSLLARLATGYRAGDDEVGVIAVDPTSPFSGGALLGDRIRMNDLATDTGIFIRSMATRGSLGGLATTTKEVLDLMDAFGFPRILVETVGVGQTELEITGATDTVVVVLTPESGDAVQAMKAGLMEIADIFVVNKADRPGADRLVKEIRQALHLRVGNTMQGVPAHHGVDLSRVTKSSEGGGVTETRPRTNVGARPSGAEEPDTELWSIPVIKTVAQSGEGVSELADTMEAHREHLLVSGELEQRREARARGRVRDVVERELRRVAWQSAAVEAELLVGLEGIAQGTETPYSVASRILAGLLAGEG